MPCAWMRTTLETGDYSVQGFETSITIERKRPAELYQCFGHDRERFEREYVRMATYRRAVVIIEGTMRDIVEAEDVIRDICARHGVEPKVTKDIVIRSLSSWYARYGVPFIPAGSKEAAQTLAYHILTKFFSQNC